MKGEKSETKNLMYYFMCRAVPDSGGTGICSPGL